MTAGRKPNGANAPQRWARKDTAGDAVSYKKRFEEIQRATAWLHTTGLHIEPAERSVFG